MVRGCISLLVLLLLGAGSPHPLRAAEATATATATVNVAPAAASKAAAGVIAYPETRRGDVVDDYFGTRVPDPYRWLEDPDDPETRAWIDAQNAVTFRYLEAIPERDAIRERLTKLWNYPKYGTPHREGDWYIFSKNDGLQNHSVVYKQRSLDGVPSVLIDPNAFSAAGTVALTSTSFSFDGRYMAYGKSTAGSDWVEYSVREVESGKDLPDRLERIKFSGVSWTHDHKGFFYGRFPSPEGNELTATNRNHKLYYHALGTDQSADRLVYERPDEPEWGFDPRVTEDGRYVVLSIWKGTDRRNRTYYMDLENRSRPRLDAPVVPLLDDFDAGYDLVGNDGSVFYFVTDLDAPKSRLIAIDTKNPERAAWRTVVPEAEDALDDVALVGDKFIATYLHDARTLVRLFSMDGKAAGEIAFPTLGKAAGFKGKRKDMETFYSFTSYLYPTTVFRYDIATGQSTVFRKPEIDFDPSGYETEQVFFESKDGTRVPMFLTHRKGIARDGTNPTLLYGYGGFQYALTPSFSVSNLVWLEMGGIYASVNLRGGSEYGEAWHAAGMKEKKQNVFDDFIAAAEYLTREGYTSREKLAMHGGSNGGLLVGAAMTQRPDLFAVAVPEVGVMDMLRFHKFTIGWGWASDYGSSDDPAGFKYLSAYSPLHNLKAGTEYPATLVMTADHDDRVVPAHSFKFAATLQGAQAGEEPVLIRIDSNAGHGAGMPTMQVINEVADRWAFIVHNLHMKVDLGRGSDGL
jgi:prolyl oligopeptidase